MSKETFKNKLAELVATFERNKDVYKDKNSSFNEAQLREQFVNPMFLALGWDMYNEQGYAEQYKEVVHEDKVIIKGKPKAPDYSFRIGGQRKFFLEAKQPFVKIKTEYDPALQIRRYAWSARLPISILTDFEEFAIYDTTIEPRSGDISSVSRIEYITYDEYLTKWEQIYDLFAKESILKGSFDKYVAKEKKGKQAVDKIFLSELEKWREWIAKDIAKNNPSLNIEQLNYAVQKLIDRIIFLRIAEDRGIEDYKNLETIIKSYNSYKELLKIFGKAHDKYNSGLFDFNEDKLTPTLNVSDNVLDRILSQLYYPKSPYEFSVLGVELLGSIYEQFLGKVIRLTSGHNAMVEEKPEVKKAGGVYYTPQYIVEYIVKNTVGELVKDKTPKQVEKLRIVDPACGSGSFLIGAYEFLLDWHLDYYSSRSEAEKSKLEKEGVIYKLDLNDDLEDKVVSWNLTTSEKKKIMINNIYGVDIDSQAVEVTKLSLALKMLENENHQTINKQMKLIPDRILPDLSSNIKCGNSLIGSDYWNDKDISQFTDEEIRKVNVFDWEKEFPEVFKGGMSDEASAKSGFDAVVGNPPWGSELTLNTKQYLKNKFPKVDSSTPNSFTYFIGLSLFIGKSLSIVLPDSLLIKDYSKTRLQIKDRMNEILWIQNTGLPKEYIAFNNVDHDVIVILVGHISKKMKVTLNRFDKEKNSFETKSMIHNKVDIVQDNLESIFNIQLDVEDIKLKKKTSNLNILSDYMQCHEGIHSGNIRKKLFVKEYSEGYKKLFIGAKNGDFISRYYAKAIGYYVDYRKELINKGNSEYASLRDESIFVNPKIYVTRTGNPFKAFYDEDTYASNNFFSLQFKELINNTHENLKYILGIVNSRFANYYIRKHVAPRIGKAFIETKITHLLKIPIIFKKDKSAFVLLNKVDMIIENLAYLHSENISDSKKQVINLRVDLLDREIDALVYELYGLTNEEIEVIEKAV